MAFKNIETHVHNGSFNVYRSENKLFLQKLPKVFGGTEVLVLIEKH